MTSVTLAELAYAIVEGKWLEARNLADAYYSEGTHVPVARSRIGPDGDWDPRVDSGGRHADHPDFGTELRLNFRNLIQLGFMAAFWDGTLHAVDFFGLGEPWGAVLLFGGAALLGLAAPPLVKRVR